MDNDTIECPKDKESRYFLWACEEIFRKKGLRPWCRKCDAFERAAGRVSEPDPAGSHIAGAAAPATVHDKP